MIYQLFQGTLFTHGPSSTTGALGSSTTHGSSDFATDTDASMQTNVVIPLLTVCITLVLLVTSIVACVIFYRKQYRVAEKADTEDKSTLPDRKCKPSIVPILGILKGKLDMPTKDDFDRLFQYQDKIESKLSTYQGKRNNDKIGLNAKPNIFPYDHNRIKLKAMVDDSDYINASLISSLRRSDDPSYDELIYTSYVPTFQIQFIIGQEPGKNTWIRHFQMIHEQRVHVVISLHRGNIKRQLMVGNIEGFQHMTRFMVQNIQVTDTMCVYIYELFNTTSVETQYKTQVLFFDIFDFPKTDHFDVEDARNLLTNIASIRKQIKAKNNGLKMMVYDDEAGLSGASIFVALYETLESVDCSVNEHNQLKQSAEDVNVFEVVNGLRKDRMNAVNTFEGYKFLHLCLMEYGPNRKTYDAIQSKPLNTSSLPKDKKLVMKKTTADEENSDRYSLDDVEYLLPNQYLIHHEYVI